MRTAFVRDGKEAALNGSKTGSEIEERISLPVFAAVHIQHLKKQLIIVLKGFADIQDMSDHALSGQLGVPVFYGLENPGMLLKRLGVPAGNQNGFGIVFGLGWTPCIGAFLGSALMLASSQASWTQGILLLLCYSAGLGIPFLISAVLIQKLKTTFDWIKSHYGIINRISGGLLILVGILMMTGLMNQYLAWVS